MMGKTITAMFLFILFAVFDAPCVLQAQQLDAGVSSISSKLGKALAGKGEMKIAPFDFEDSKGRPNELGKFLSNQVSDSLVNEKGIRIADRDNIKRLLQEHKLVEEGLINKTNAKKLGQIAAVDAFLTGTVVEMDKHFLLNVKIISADTYIVIAAQKQRFEKTGELARMFRNSSRLPAAQSASGETVAKKKSAPPVNTGHRGIEVIYVKKANPGKKTNGTQSGIDGGIMFNPEGSVGAVALLIVPEVGVHSLKTPLFGLTNFENKYKAQLQAGGWPNITGSSKYTPVLITGGAELRLSNPVKPIFGFGVGYKFLGIGSTNVAVQATGTLGRSISIVDEQNLCGHVAYISTSFFQNFGVKKNQRIGFHPQLGYGWGVGRFSHVVEGYNGSYIDNQAKMKATSESLYYDMSLSYEYQTSIRSSIGFAVGYQMLNFKNFKIRSLESNYPILYQTGNDVIDGFGNPLSIKMEGVVATIRLIYRL